MRINYIIILLFLPLNLFSFETSFSDSLWKEVHKHKGEDAIEYMLNNFYPVFNQNDKDGIVWMNRCLSFSKQTKNQQLIGRSHLNLGICFFLRGDYPQCLFNYQTALGIFEGINDKQYIGRTCNELSVYSRRQKQFKKGLEYLDRSFEMCIASGDSVCVETSLNNRAVIYEMMGEFDLALTYYYKAIDMAQRTKNYVGLAYIYSDAAECYRQISMYDSSAVFIDKSLAIFEQVGNHFGFTMCLMNKASLLALQKKHNESIEAFYQTIKLSERRNYTDLLKVAHYELGNVFVQTGEFEKAVFHIDKSYTLRDSLFNQERINALSEMEVKYETEKIENDYLTEQRERIASDLKVANRNKWLMGLSGFFAASIFLGLFLYQRRLKLTQAEKDRAIILEREKGLQAVFDATEEERQRIAKDLHDGVGQQMSGLKMAWENLSLSIKGINEKEAARIDELSQILDKTASEVREISHQMMPKVLDEFGLIPAIEEMLERSLKLTPLNYSFEHYNIEQRFTRKIELSLFRITQELLNNVIKHSGATIVSVQLFKNQNQLILIVEDNGRGFNMDDKKEGHGLLNIHSRLNTIHGEVNYDASQTAGTTATIRIDLGK